MYVGNIPFSVTETDIHKLFSNHGFVSEVKLIRDRHSGQLRGFGFVTMENADEMAVAIKALNDFAFQGQPLKVIAAKEPVVNQ